MLDLRKKKIIKTIHLLLIETTFIKIFKEKLKKEFTILLCNINRINYNIFLEFKIISKAKTQTNSVIRSNQKSIKVK